MKNRQSLSNRAKVFSGSAFLLMAAGLAINVLLSKLALYFELPLFLDSVGTVLAAALGGYLPGIAAGFLTNVVNGISDPITLYYGIVSILIGAAAGYMARRRAYARFGTAMLTSVPYALLGGGFGSVLTWMLYGFSFGSGISAPFAISMYENAGMDKFWAQFAADMGIDAADKLITVIIVFAAVRIIDRKLPGRFRNSEFLEKLTPERRREKESGATKIRRYSVRSKIIAIIICTSVALCSAAITISFLVYRETMISQYTAECRSVAELMRRIIDGDSVNKYLSDGGDASYDETKRKLIEIRDSFGTIEYMYVYQIREDGCHVVFDLDTPELPGEPLGGLVPFDESFSAYRGQLLRGEEIDPVISNDSYGWLLTVYKPVTDSTGKCVAYAAADIPMTDVITEQYVFIIRMVSLLFGLTVLLIICASWFADTRIVGPINSMTLAARRFAYDTESDRKNSTAYMESLGIATGDEIENLYQSMSKTVHDFSTYISLLNENAKTISNLHRGMILSFAELVESRDSNTGKHLRRTAAYVRAVADELRRSGLYPELLTDAYIESLEENAPLHDIGKAGIPDTILNKPGRLTSEEFEMMKTHTVAGRKLLTDTAKNIDDEHCLREAINMACCHHERWDGTGYPEGLCGRDIPLSARIMAVADVFDALVSKRSYKEPFTIEKAFAIIEEESGTHFDPDIAEAFVRIKPQIIAIQLELNDGGANTTI